MGGGGVLPKYTGMLERQWGTFFRPQVYERGGYVKGLVCKRGRVSGKNLYKRDAFWLTFGILKGIGWRTRAERPREIPNETLG